MKWVVDAIQNGTAIWVTDGSYNCTLAPHISGAGWLIYCNYCKRKLCGSFFEYSHKAGSYRRELLGLLAIHTLLAALEEYNKIPPSSVKVCYNNEGALYKSKEFRRRIQVRASQADIKRALRNVKCGMKVKLTYEWVQSHQDCYKLWHQLTIDHQLNCYRNTLAKDVVARSLTITSAPSRQRLPR